MNENKSTYEHLSLIINRYDHYLDVINTKGTFLISIYTFLITITLYNINEILRIENCSIFTMMSILLILGLILLFFGIFFVLKAVFPWLKFENDTQKKSLIFFGSVSQYSNEDYISKMSTNSKEDNIKDLSDQVHVLSNALTKKYKLISKSMNILYLIGIIVITLLVLLAVNEVIK
ncbi:MAG: hypothetical protein CVV25_04020 [Ignavibacteriae bacterium HGW-Ignavibacteriae-4]|nr:MAG: hypothetical protein CVV25_04020 [Ignavibacteriae bacterium HGW-Ignavibacteriae-4]